MSLWTDAFAGWMRDIFTWTGELTPRHHTRRSLVGSAGTGSRTLSFPLRLDASGRIVTIQQLTPRHAAEIVGHVLSCEPGERGLAPAYGLADQAGRQAISGDLIASTVTACEPDVAVTDVYIEQAEAGKVRVKVSAAWAASVEVD